MKGISQVDYAIAVGLFIGLFAFSLLFITDKITLLKEETKSAEMRNYAKSVLDEFFNENSNLSIISKEYRFLVVVNNSQPFLKNQSALLSDLTNELILINFTQLGLSDIDFNSVRVYNENDEPIDCYISSTNKILEFTTNISMLDVQRFYVYFDDDSSFPAAFCNSSITGNDNLSETIYPPEELDVVQYKKIKELSLYDRSHLVAYWGLDEIYGTAFGDYSGNENHGTFYGETFYDGTIYGANWTDGKYERALGFDGLNDYVEVGDVILDGLPSFSVSVWIKPTSLVSNTNPLGHGYSEDYIIHKAGAGDDNFGLTVSTGGVAFYIDTGTDYTITADAPPTSEWTHIVAIYDGAQMYLYINGELKNTTTATGSLISNTNSLQIGGRSDINEYFNGTIDEVYIYNRSLNETEIELLYRGLAKYYQVKSSLGLSYDFHITIKDSLGSNLFDFGPSVPKRAEIYALDRPVVFQTSDGRLEEATLYVYLWK